MLPLIHARLLPAVSTVRRSSKVSSTSKPASFNQSLSQALRTVGISNSALTSVRFAPSRTQAVSARAPSASCSASIKIDLPAPVSPVSTVKPLLKSSSSSRTMTKSRSAILFSAMLKIPLRSNAVFCEAYRNSSTPWGAKTALNIVIL